MGYRLGVDLGTSFTTAAIERVGSAAAGSLGVDSAVVPSTVYIGADGERLYGHAATERVRAEPHRVLRGFVRRIGDDTPMLPEAGPMTSAHKIAADFVAWVVAQASVQEGRAPAAVAVSHPATWGPHKQQALLTALLSAGVPGPTLVADPVAAATAAAVGRSYPAGATLAVYDLGGRTFDAALVRREASGAWTLVGRPAGLLDLGGANLDDLVLAHVVASLSAEHQLAFAALDADDADTSAALTALRAACVAAKETLSSRGAASIDVKLPGIRGTVRLTRGEFETMIAPTIDATVDVLDAVVSGAGLVAGDLDHILVTGGSSRIPLVTEALSRHFHLAVVNAGGQQAGTAIAAGAALTLPKAPTAAASVPPAAPARPATATPPKPRKAVVGRSSSPARPEPVDVRAAMPLPKPAAEVPAMPAAPVAMSAAVAEPAGPVVAEPVAVRTEQPGDAPVGVPVVEAGTTPGAGSKPIRPRRASRRSEIVGLEGLVSGRAQAHAAEPAVAAPRAVIPARAVASVEVLLAEEPLRAPRTEETLPPPRPALDDAGFDRLEIVDEIEERDGWSPRSLFSFRRSVALTALTAAIYVGATAWNPATPAITDQSSATVHAAPAQHAAP